MSEPVVPVESTPAPSIGDVWKATSAHAFDPEIDLGQTLPEPKKPEAKAEVKPAPKPEEKPVETPVVVHTSRSKKLAADLGIDIAALSQDELDDEIYFRTRALATRPAEAKPEPKPAPKEEEVELDWGTDADGKPIKDEDIHPALVRQFKSLAKVKKDLEAKLTAAEQREAQREAAAQAAPIVKAFDDTFESLNEQYGGIFGKGPLASLKPGSPAHTLRLAVEKAADVKSFGDIGPAIKKAAAAFFGGFKPAAPVEEVAKPIAPRAENGRFTIPAKPTAEDFEQAASPRPTSRTPPVAPKGREAAEKAAAKFLNDNGMLED